MRHFCSTYNSRAQSALSGQLPVDLLVTLRAKYPKLRALPTYRFLGMPIHDMSPPRGLPFSSTADYHRNTPCNPSTYITQTRTVNLTLTAFSNF